MMLDVRCTIWGIRAPKAREMRSGSGGGRENMAGDWFERSADFAELCHRLGKSYVVIKMLFIDSAVKNG